ncbi:hypothetical protein [Cupriavidus basilensis]|uniref:hypothetical protein n=1 Tax=Cupriavidus basilensis TaxID=68895 RepID=UPI0007C77872|nr:hypothetical protein [Cupriavidus basilensis]
MKIKRISDDVEVELSQDELLVLNAALNEACNGIDVFEFETRIGASRANVERLLAEIQAALDQIDERQRIRKLSVEAFAHSQNLSLQTVLAG